MSLVERTFELGELERALQDASTGHGRLVVIEGPAGIGKTSLLSRTVRLARRMGSQVAVARGRELERAFGFGVVRQLFEPFLVQASEIERADLLAGAAGPARRVVGIPEPQSPGVNDFAVLHGLYWLTANICQRGFLTIVIDDLHLLDKGSLRYLAYLQTRIEGLPIAVICATRPHEPGAEQAMIHRLLHDTTCTVLEPAPLSGVGSAQVLSAALALAADPEFELACHRATGGNPLLLRELARAVTAERLAPTRDNAVRVDHLGASALRWHLDVRLAQLPWDCSALARAAALLGDDAPLLLAGTLAQIKPRSAARAARRLEQVHILRRPHDVGPHLLRFQHSLVRAAVYDSQDRGALIDGHAQAARLLYAHGADPEQAAGHLLRVPPADGQPSVVETLRQAASNARARGSPDTAVTFLQRCVVESGSGEVRLEVLEELGFAALAVDKEVAVRALEEVLGAATDRIQRVRVAIALGNLYVLLLRFEDATAAWVLALSELEVGEEATARHIEARLINLAVIEPRRLDLFTRLTEVRERPFHDSVGGRALEAMIAAFDSFQGDPQALDHARRALSDGLLVAHTPDESPLVVAWLVLIFGDDVNVMDSIESAVAHAYRRGAVGDLAAALTIRALGRLRQGDLLGAEDDAREAVAGVESGRIAIARPFLGPFHADLLLEQGRLAEAAEALEWAGVPNPVPAGGPFYYYLDTRSRLLRAQGHIHEALDCAIAAGRRFAAHGADNPAWIPWRTEAAMCLHALGDATSAREHAAEEVRIARRFGAPRALGHALRIAGLVANRDSNLALLREAVITLENSTAHLEHAKALADLGAALRRMGQRAEAKKHLIQGAEIAEGCGATSLREYIEMELRAAGARPRQLTVRGLHSLTPSEQRVARMTVKGLSNRDVAQALFVTTKTVESHLGSVYRKLDITRRDQLAEHFLDIAEATDSRSGDVGTPG